jgi:tetratricopeptide (TPR) repeat protein
MTNRQRSGLGCIAIAVLTFSIFGRVGSHEFVNYDSDLYVTGNPWVLRGLTWRGVGWAFGSLYADNWHPLTWISHMLDVQLFGLEPGPHNLMSCAFHAANACLVFLVLLEMTAQGWKSFLVAVLFAIHPLHVESVAWIAERKDVLSAFFGLGCLGFWVRWRRTGLRSLYLLSLICFACSLMSKPMLVTWPIVLWILDRWPLTHTDPGARPRAVHYLPLFVLSAACSAVTLLAQRSGNAIASLRHIPLVERIENACLANAAYIGKFVWPVDLSFFYPHPGAHIDPKSVIAGAILLAALSCMALANVRRAPWCLAGWLLFVVMLLPVIGIIQVGEQSMADRYMYLPSLGLFIAIVWTAGRWVETEPRVRPLVSVLAAAACAVLSLLCWRQVGVWKTTRTLTEHAIALNPQNPVAHGLLGRLEYDAGDLPGAEAEFRAALRASPSDVFALSNLALLEDGQGRHADAEALLRRAIQENPFRASLYVDLALVVHEESRREEALALVNEAMRREPSSTRGELVRGELLAEIGRNDEAREAFRRALTLAQNSEDTPLVRQIEKRLLMLR